MKGISAPERSGKPGPAREPAHILVVDDEEGMRQFMRMQLKGGGYQVSTAEDAVEAGHRLLQRMPDLIIADCEMPYMDGIEFVRAMRADVTIPDIPVIFTARVENSAALAGKTFGFPILTKPVLVEELLSTVARELRVYALRGA